MNPVAERLTPGTKVPRLQDRRACPSVRQSLLPALARRPAPGKLRRVLAGSLEWSGSFQCAFDHTGQRVRALCGVNPFASTYYLEPDKTFATPVMLWAWSSAGAGT